MDLNGNSYEKHARLRYEPNHIPQDHMLLSQQHTQMLKSSLDVCCNQVQPLQQYLQKRNLLLGPVIIYIYP